MIKKILFIILLAIAYALGRSQEQLELFQTPPKVIRENTIFGLVQGFRVNNLMNPYVKSELLCNIAQTRLKDVEKKFSHEGFRADRFCKDCFMGENIAENYTDEQVLLDAWLNSASHSANLHAPFSKSCIKTDGNKVVQIFGDI